MTILTKPSKSSKKEYLYAVFSSVLLSQVIAILYPEKFSAEQVEEEKAAVRKLFGAHKMPLVIELAITAAFVAFAAYVLYTALYSDSARSKGISDSYLNVFRRKLPWEKCWMTSLRTANGTTTSRTA